MMKQFISCASRLFHRFISSLDFVFGHINMLVFFHIKILHINRLVLVLMLSALVT